MTEAAVKITPEDEESQALRRYLALTELCDAAISRGDQISVVPLLRSAEQAHRTLQVVRENRIAFEEKSGRLIDRQKTIQFFHESLGYLRDLLLMMPAGLAHRINPQDPVPIEIIIGEEVERMLLELSSRRSIAEKKFPAPEADKNGLQEPVGNSATFSAT
jgi:hypothetical protein